MIQKFKDWYKDFWIENKENSKSLRNILIFTIIFFPIYLLFSLAQAKKRKRIKEDALMRATMKLYKINIYQNFLGTRKEMVMRDIPLTEEQLDEIEKDFNKGNYSELSGL